ncbi:PREDICTED: LOW QUALITY PROTEIN: mitochondrial outer membrane protein porin 2-like [Erythranthe guttata]|nr:PREDICTED: LOW QUALITY PROTEIN: mitochondrial outer membrane protein porin 2-like [Erythranthe guttata]|eukprot:XP_012855610.1 PREDICTED: LOW QUALITY PROTEIN: mitochondrial outer membrane protein porin 2-like [Erythranthe guttata]
MSKGPGLFSDIGKKAKDLLTKDYLSDHKFSVSTYSESGVALTTSTVKKAGYSSGDVAAQYIYKNTSADLKVDTENYFHPHASLTAAVGHNQAPQIDLTVTLGTSTFALGAEAGYETTSGKLTKYTAGITVTKPDSSISVILGNKGDTITASYVHYMDELKKSAAVGEIARKFSTNENTITVGGSYAIDPLTLVKLKLNNHGSLGAVLQHEVIRKSFVTISSEFDTKALEKTPKFGASLILKP